MSRREDAIQSAQTIAEDFLRDLSDDDYVEACEELSDYFTTCADAKREEQDKE